MEDMLLECIQCENDFTFTAGEQLKYERMGFSEPRRCPQCRRHKVKQNDGWERKKQKTKHKNHRMKHEFNT